jgi:thiol-disulfide isomerase/thioredoxin
MSNRNSSSRTRPGAASGGRAPRWLWPVAAGLVVLVAVVAVVLGGGDKEPEVEAGIEQVRPVTVTGTALPVLVEGADAAVGQVAPELRGADFDGTKVNVAHDGRGKVLVFAAHWCPHCQREVPVLVAHLADNPEPSGVDIVLVSTSVSRDQPNFPPSSWLRGENWPYPVLVDDANSSASTAYGLPGFPYFVALDAEGKVVARTSGEIPASDFDRLLALAAG